MDKEIVVAGGFTTDLGPLESTKEEADKRLTLHAVHSQFYTVVVSSRDTGVLLILVSHFQSMQYQQLWMKLGTSKKWRYVPIQSNKRLCRID